MNRVDEQSFEPTTQKLLPSEDLEEDAVVYVKAKRSRWSLFRSWFGSFALGVACTSLVFGLITLRSNMMIKNTYTFADTDPLPAVPYETIVFQPDPIYSQRSSDESDYAWDMLLPNGRGYVFVPDAESRGLIAGEETEWGPIYSVSMFHQLHCLARIRKSYFMFSDAITTGETGMARMFTGREASQHVQHCLDFLRVAIQCAGDMTLEWPKQDGPSSKAKVDGWGIPHKCKSRTAIEDFMEKFHFNASLSFDAAG